MFPNCGWELSATPSMTSKSANSQLHFVKGKLGSEKNNGKVEACTGQGAWNNSTFVNMSFGEFCNFTFSPIEKTKQCAFLGMNQDLVTLSANPLYNCMYLYVTNNVYSQCFNKFLFGLFNLWDDTLFHSQRCLPCNKPYRHFERL